MQGPTSQWTVITHPSSRMPPHFSGPHTIYQPNNHTNKQTSKLNQKNVQHNGFQYCDCRPEEIASVGKTSLLERMSRDISTDYWTKCVMACAPGGRGTFRKTRLQRSCFGEGGKSISVIGAIPLGTQSLMKKSSNSMSSTQSNDMHIILWERLDTIYAGCNWLPFWQQFKSIQSLLRLSMQHCGLTCKSGNGLDS